MNIKEIFRNSALYVGSMGLALSLLAFGFTWKVERELAQGQFEKAALGQIRDLENTLRADFSILQFLGDFMDNSEFVSRAQFHAFAVSALSRTPNIQALEWIPRVPASERQHYELMASFDGFIPFYFMERVSQGVMKIAEPRIEYFPVYYVEPYVGNEIALGFDLGSEAMRLATMNDSRASGEPRSTGRITLVQETGQQYGFLTFIPIYQKGLPLETPIQRTERLKGFILGVFRIGDIVTGAIGAKNRIHLFDLSAPPEQQRLFPKDALETLAQLQSSPHVEKELELAGRRWLAIVTPERDISETAQTWWSWTILGTGVLSTLLLSAYVSQYQKRREERQVAAAAFRDHAKQLQVFRQVMDNTKDAMEIIDCETGFFVDVNKAACEQMGYGREELLRLRVVDIDPNFPDLETWHNKISEDGAYEGRIIESTHVRRDGSTFPIEVAFKVVDISGRRLGVANIRDITERKQAEKKIQELLDFNSKVINASASGFLAYAENGQCILANEAASRMVGGSVRTLLAQNFHNLSSWKQGGLLAAAEKVLETDEPQHLSTHLITTFGKELWLDCELTSFTSGGEKHLLVALHDIGDIKRAEAALHQAQKMDALGTLTGGLAHEINNMLLPIVSLSELTMKELPQDSRARLRLEKISEAGRRAANLVGDLVTFAQRGQGEEKREKIDICHTVSAKIPFLRNMLPTTIEIAQDIEAEPIFVMGEADAIGTILMNLASNAADAMEGKIGRLGITLRRIDIDESFLNRIPGLWVGPYVQLSVSDTGTGMDETTLQKIFDPFFTTKPVGIGTGLGMSIIHGIVVSHDGAISMTSQPGAGTTVDIYLPRVDG